MLDTPVAMKPAALLSLLLLSAPCLPSCASSGGVRADISKIRPWTTDLEHAEPLPTPYVVDFELGSKALTFLAVDHSNEAASSSLRLVEGVMDSRRYSAVVLEGIPRSIGLNPAGFLSRAEKDGVNGFFREGERSVAVRMAAKKAVPFVGGEPDEELIKANVLLAGFSVDDLFFFYVLRQVPLWRKDGTLTRGGFEEAYAEHAPLIGERLGYQEGREPGLEAFHKWYQARLGRPFRPRDVSQEMVAPFGAGELYTQRLSAVTTRVRDEHIVRVVEEMLNRYGRVLMVYESSHFPMQRLALESMLGKPQRISDHP